MENDRITIDVEKMMLSATGPVNLSVKTTILKGELVALLGSSGAGKTTLLRILAGLIKPDKGIVKMGETIWFDSTKQINISPQKRNTSLMFQDYALFPNMTVEQNIQFAQPMNNSKAVNELLSIFGLYEFRKRKPNGMSGGQKQRVALARALARKPQLLLLDEPLSALDAKMRETLQNEITMAHRLSGATTMMVSHDLNEVFRMASHMICIENGTVTRSGKPAFFLPDERIDGKALINYDIA